MHKRYLEKYRHLVGKNAFICSDGYFMCYYPGCSIKDGGVKDVEQFPLSVRVSNAIVSYVRYVVKMIWPVDLAVFYPHPG